MYTRPLEWASRDGPLPPVAMITHRQRARPRRPDVVSVVSRVWRVQVGLDGLVFDGGKVEVEKNSEQTP